MNILECEKGENFTTVSTTLLIDWLKHQIYEIFAKQHVY